MVPKFDPQDRAITFHIQQLLENERLTNALTDSSAQILLAWAENQLEGLQNANINSETLDEIANQLQRLMRYVNVIIEKLPDLDEQDMVQRMLYLIERAQEYEKSKVKIDGEKDNPK